MHELGPGGPCHSVENVSRVGVIEAVGDTLILRPDFRCMVPGPSSRPLSIAAMTAVGLLRRP